MQCPAMAVPAPPPHRPPSRIRFQFSCIDGETWLSGAAASPSVTPVGSPERGLADLQPLEQQLHLQQHPVLRISDAEDGAGASAIKRLLADLDGPELGAASRQLFASSRTSIADLIAVLSAGAAAEPLLCCRTARAVGTALAAAMAAALLQRNYAAAPELLRLAAAFQTAAPHRPAARLQLAATDLDVAAALLWTSDEFWRAAAAHAARLELSGAAPGAAAAVLHCVITLCRLDCAEGAEVPAPAPLRMPITAGFVGRVTAAGLLTPDDKAAVAAALRRRVSTANAPRLAELAIQLADGETDLRIAIKDQKPINVIRKLQVRMKAIQAGFEALQSFVDTPKLQPTLAAPTTRPRARSKTSAGGAAKGGKEAGSPMASLRKWAAQRDQDKLNKASRTKATVLLQAAWRGCAVRRAAAAVQLQSIHRGSRVRRGQIQMRDAVLRWLSTIPIGGNSAAATSTMTSTNSASSNNRRYDPTGLIRFGLAHSDCTRTVDPELLYARYVSHQTETAELSMQNSDYAGKILVVVAPRLRLTARPCCPAAAAGMAAAAAEEAVVFGAELEILEVRRSRSAGPEPSAAEGWSWRVAEVSTGRAGWVDPAADDVSMGCLKGFPHPLMLAGRPLIYKVAKDSRLRATKSLTSRRVGHLQAGQLIEAAALAVEAGGALRVRCAGSGPGGWTSVQSKAGEQLLVLVPPAQQAAAADALVGQVLGNQISKLVATVTIQAAWRRHYRAQAQRLARALREARAAAAAAAAAALRNDELTNALADMAADFRLARARAANSAQGRLQAEEECQMAMKAVADTATQHAAFQRAMQKEKQALRQAALMAAATAEGLRAENQALEARLVAARLPTLHAAVVESAAVGGGWSAELAGCTVEQLRILEAGLSVAQRAVTAAAVKSELRDEVPRDFLCPITMDIMELPVVCSDGHTYEREAISAWFAEHSTSPKTNQSLRSKHLTPNHTLKAAIQSFLSSQRLSTSSSSSGGGGGGGGS